MYVRMKILRLKIQFQATGTYKLWINDVLRSTHNTTAHTFPEIDDIMFGNDVAHQIFKYRNVILYEGLVD